MRSTFNELPKNEMNYISDCLKQSVKYLEVSDKMHFSELFKHIN